MKQKILRTLTIDSNNIPLFLASEIRRKGFKRLIGVISPDILEKVIASHILAFRKNALLSRVLGEDMGSLRIVCMPHCSPGDMNVNSTVEVVDTKGKIACTVHVGEQGSVRSV